MLDTMVPWRSTGDVLRWWRTEVLGLTQQEVAERLNVRPSALSNWERGTRAISIEMADLDEALKGEQTLEGLLWGMSTPQGLDPGRVWSKVFPGRSRPVWLWLRSPATEVSLEGEWGVARLEADFDVGPNGLFVTVGASIADSPVVIHLSEPGWADFGYGELPRTIPGASIVDAISMFSRSTADGPFMDLFSSNLASKLSAGAPEALDLAAAAPQAVSSYMRHSDRPPSERPIPKRWPLEPEGIDIVERTRFARLRRARGLSLMATAERLFHRTEIEVGRDTLRRFETDVGQPHDPVLPIALDHTLGAEGRLTVLELRSGHGSGSVALPPFWRGPMWVHLHDEEGDGQVVFRRGRWHREVTFTGPTLVSAHWFDPKVPFRIVARPSTTWVVGVGRRAGAQPVDQNWVPTSVDTAQEGLAETEQAIFDALERHSDHP